MRYNHSIGPSYGRSSDPWDFPRNELIPRTDDMFTGLRMPLMEFGGTFSSELSRLW